MGGLVCWEKPTGGTLSAHAPSFCSQAAADSEQPITVLNVCASKLHGLPGTTANTSGRPPPKCYSSRRSQAAMGGPETLARYAAVTLIQAAERMRRAHV
jgi:hypothetical protein